MAYETDDSTMKAGAEIIGKMGLLAKPNSALSDDLRAHTITALFGTIWTREGLALQERSLITLASLISLNREHELRIHFRGARNLGISKEKIEEVILHLAHYSGWPTAVTASSVLCDVWDEMDQEMKG